MNRRRFVVAVLAAASSPGAVAAAPMRRVVVVDDLEDPSWRADHARWFKAEGWTAGHDLAIEYARSDADLGRILASKPDAIIVSPGDDIGRLKALGGEVPLVFANLCCDPVRLGLVDSLGRPGGRLTGTMWPEVLVDKHWAVGKQLDPGLRRMGVLHDGLSPALAGVLREAMHAAAARLHLEPVEIVVPKRVPFARVEALVRQARVDAVDVWAGDLPWEAELMRYLERHRMVGLWSDEQVMRGGLAGVWADGRRGFFEAVAIVSRILRGARVAEIPVQTIRAIHIGLNMGAARRMGIQVPPELLTAADIKIG